MRSAGAAALTRTTCSSGFRRGTTWPASARITSNQRKGLVGVERVGMIWSFVSKFGRATSGSVEIALRLRSHFHCALSDYALEYNI